MKNEVKHTAHSSYRCKSALLSAAWNAGNWAFETLKAHYKTLVRYLNLDDQGMILGKGRGTPSMTERSGYPKLDQLGRSANPKKHLGLGNGFSV